MAGFTLQRREISLLFASDTDLAGLEIIAKLDVPLSLFLEFQSYVSDNSLGDTDTTGIKDAFSLFAEKILISWNLEDDNGADIEPTVEQFFELPPRVATRIIEEWSSQVSEPDPLHGTTLNNISPSEQDNGELMVLSPQSPSS
jgi:hypothetical protein